MKFDHNMLPQAEARTAAAMAAERVILADGAPLVGLQLSVEQHVIARL